MESPIHDVICPTTLESVQLHWNLYHVIPKGQHLNMSNYVGICPTTLESVQLHWNLYHVIPWGQPLNLSNYDRICPTTLESVQLRREFVQLRWIFNNYNGI